MILTKQYYTHKTSLSLSPFFPLSSLFTQFFLTAEIRALSYRFDEGKKKAFAPESRRVYERGVSIILDFSLQVKRHKRDKYESNFIYTHTRIRDIPARLAKLRGASLFVINETRNLQ